MKYSPRSNAWNNSVSNAFGARISFMWMLINNRHLNFARKIDFHKDHVTINHYVNTGEGFPRGIFKDEWHAPLPTVRHRHPRIMHANKRLIHWSAYMWYFQEIFISSPPLFLYHQYTVPILIQPRDPFLPPTWGLYGYRCYWLQNS